LLLEDQFGVGDKITANDISGIVESVGLRVTTLRDESNVLWYVRNGDIVKVGNSSQAK
jgi:small-conductance mechanosensitive channel